MDEDINLNDPPAREPHVMPPENLLLQKSNKPAADSECLGSMVYFLIHCP